MNIEKDVLKKTNKYVYLSNGTHMSHGDFYHYKQDIRNELAIIHAKEYKDSIEVVVQSSKEREKLEKILENIQEKNYALELDIQMSAPNNRNWEESFKMEANRNRITKDKLVNHARKLYSDLSSLSILKDYQNDKGIKFIIQENYDIHEYRFCFDPYELGDNFHSSISEFYRSNHWSTINGGWMKVIDNIVTLYAQSGDYGVYDDEIAIKCIESIFTNKTIKSFAGKSWENTNI